MNDPQDASDLDPELELQAALDKACETRELLYAAIGAYLVDMDWQAGRPVPDHVRRLRSAHEDLGRVIGLLQEVVEER